MSEGTSLEESIQVMEQHLSYLIPAPLVSAPSRPAQRALVHGLVG